MPVGFLCEATTRPQAVEVAVYVALQQSRRVIGWPAGCSGGRALQAERREGEVVNKGIKEADGILCGHGVVEPLREQALFMAVRAVDKAHESTQLQKSK